MKEHSGQNDQLQKEEVQEIGIGKKFEDLTPEEMKKIQGSGDISAEKLTDITVLFRSNPPYKC